MADMTLLAFAVVAIIGIATPGPTVLLALANGSRFGIHRAMIGMAGAVLSDFVLIGVVALGLGWPSIGGQLRKPLIYGRDHSTAVRERRSTL